MVSIHAPARGATETGESGYKSLRVSIHAPARGATSSSTMITLPLAFQSTPLREGRPGRHTLCHCDRCFNPRPCARGDNSIAGQRRGQSVSIHAPARGATVPVSVSGDTHQFQSTPLREGRQRICIPIQHLFEFQSTPLREGRPRIHQDAWTGNGFNPRPCARGDQWDAIIDGLKAEFQSTPLREGRPELV